ncbi:MAG: hypothetical protein K8S87_02990 [Planctomycetes bacterium]|nr:hypothetical protein [Planctomycetota bacterium]
MSDKEQNDLPSKEEVKKKAGLAWTMIKGLFRLLIPKKMTKPRIIVAICVLIIIVFIINKIITFVLGSVIWIAAAVLLVAGIYMVFSGKNPISKNKD